jgi:hypothetical protein
LRRNSDQVLSTAVWRNVGTNVLLTPLSDSILTGLGITMRDGESGAAESKEGRKGAAAPVSAHPAGGVMISSVTHPPSARR